MATKKSKPQTRSRRNLPSHAAPAPNLEALHEHIEQERARLMDAEAVLDCVIYAMEEDVRMEAPGPSYSDVVRIVRGFIHSTIDQLDSVYIKAAIAAPNCSEGMIEECGGVKETPPAYVH